MKRLIVAAALAVYGGYAAVKWLGVDKGLVEPDISAGPWYFYYLGDFLQDHPDVENFTSAIAQDSGGDLWLTDTPEWDREWFNEFGFEFPTRWMPFTQAAS